MLIDTHTHINMMIKKEFDTLITDTILFDAQQIINDANHSDVKILINVGTSLPESLNSVFLAQRFASVFATVGIHPNDCSENWQNDFKEIKKLAINKEKNKIVGIGECGIDKHYPHYNMQRQIDAFKAHIELALQLDLALVVHSRDAADETLRVIEEFKQDIKRATMHCFSYDQKIADEIIAWGFFIGIDGPITYPKNTELRNIVINTPLKHIVLETDAPFLPPQNIRGKQNHPQQIKTIATYIAELRGTTLEEVATATSNNAKRLFNLDKIKY